MSDLVNDAYEFIGNLKSDMFSDLVSAIDAPLIGWLTTFLGLGGSSGDQGYQTIETQLAAGQ
jgi:hypothetical protein